MARSKKGMKKFHGLFALHFMNLLRSIRHSKQTVAVNVMFSDKDSGMIYFDKGKLVHAECKDAIGEEAFIKIMELRDGKYTKMLEKTADVVSIERDVRVVLTEYNKSKSTEKQMPQLEFGEIEEVVEPAGPKTQAPEAEWTPPQPPKHGLQEEAWMADWGEKTEGFRWARVVKPDGGRVMGVKDEADAAKFEESGFAELLGAAANVFGTEQGKGWKLLYLESEQSLCAVADLLEGYLLIVNLDRPWIDLGSFARHLGLLVKALNDTLERA